MTYVLERELQGQLDLAILFYARAYPDKRTGESFGVEPGDKDPVCAVDVEASRQRAYGRLEGLLLALNVDPSNPCAQVALHEDINTARLFLERCPDSLAAE